MRLALVLSILGAAACSGGGAGTREVASRPAGAAGVQSDATSNGSAAGATGATAATVAAPPRDPDRASAARAKARDAVVAAVLASERIERPCHTATRVLLQVQAAVRPSSYAPSGDTGLLWAEARIPRAEARDCPAG